MKRWYQKELLIFDFDGTLVDTNHLHYQAYLEVFEPWQISFALQDIHGLKSKDAIINILNQNDIYLEPSDIEKLISQKQEIARALIDKNLEVSPDVHQFLVNAFSYHQLAVVSAGSKKTVKSTLEKLEIFDFFKELICAEDVEVTKPHPEGFLLALNKMQILPPSALIFEDSDVGFLAAKASGIEYIDVNDFDWEY